MSEIRKALVDTQDIIRVHLATPEELMPDDFLKVLKSVDEALALLPPEGETRNDESDTWDLVTWLQVQARASALPYKTCRRLNDAAEEILKLRAAPAPSSEKDLAALVIQPERPHTLREIADMASSEKALREALTSLDVIENTLDEMKEWDTGHPNKAVATALFELRSIRALLASSPTPSEVKP